MARRRKKTEKEARTERVTWFLMVLVFGILYIVPVEMVPNWTVPTAGAIILLGSGVYQYARRWHVSPITWIAGTVMLLLGMANFYVYPELNFFGLTLLTFALVIGIGVLTGET
jgi:hypothetical protein